MFLKIMNVIVQDKFHLFGKYIIVTGWKKNFWIRNL